MTDGEWRIWQPDRITGGTKRDVIPVRQTPNGPEPHVFAGNHYIHVRYENGHQTFYPWANIVRAEYDPPTNP